MKRILLCLLASMAVFQAFADEAPKPKSELYGKFRLDYDLTEAMVEAAQPLYGGWNIDRARFGFNTMMFDNLKALLELEAKPTSSASYGAFELRIAEVDWKIMDLLTLSAGRMYEVFAPKSEAYGKFFDGVGVSLHFDMLKAFVQTGNDKDKGISGDHITVMPGLVFTPPLGDLKLEVGLNGKAKFDTTVSSPLFWANAYLSLKVAGLSALLDFDANRLDSSSATYFDLFGDINYKIDFFTPGIKVFYYDLANNSTAPTTSADSHFDIEPYLSFEVVKGFFINPRFTIYNLFVPEGSSRELTWKFTLRFEWNPKVAF